MAALTYRDDKILARNVFLRPFFCLTPAEPFFRPDRSSTAPSCRVAVKDGRAFRGHPKGLSLTAASTMAHWRYRSGRGSRVGSRARLVTNGKRRSSRLPASRSRRLYRSPGTPIGKSLDYLDFATIKLPAPAHTISAGDGDGDDPARPRRRRKQAIMRLPAPARKRRILGRPGLNPCWWPISFRARISVRRPRSDRHSPRSIMLVPSCVQRRRARAPGQWLFRGRTDQAPLC